MTRASLLLPLAALVAGCYSSSSNTCFPAFLNVYWTPSLTPPNGGFQVPGLVAAGFPAQLGCTDAGVTRVEVRVDGGVATCTNGVDCVGLDWRCSVNGVSVPVCVGDVHNVQVDGFDIDGNLKYRSSIVTAPAADGGDAFVGIFPQGVDGTLSIPYEFADGGNACAGASNLWFQVTRDGAVYDFVDDTSADPAAIPCTDVVVNRFIDVLTPSGSSLVPPGVYTRTRIEEVSQQGGVFVLQRTNCTDETIVHAGDDAWPVVALSASSTFCP